MLSDFIYPLISFIGVAGLIPLLRRLALARGFVDEPGGRKKHEEAVPPIGGLAVFPIFMLAALAHGVTREDIWYFSGLALLLAAGALDDHFSLPPRVKFTVQWLAALLIVMPGNAVVHDMGNLFGLGTLTLGAAGGVIFSAVAAVLLINAINLMDGLDGLAGGQGFVTLLWLVVCGLEVKGAVFMPALLLGALAGFLAHNMRHPWRARASVFLGDSGSLALGLSLAWFAIHMSQGADAALRPVSVAWLLAIPIFDTCGQFARRVSQGRHPFDADHNHFHHHFINAGLTPGQATACILALSFALGLIGVGGAWLGVPDFVLAYAWTGLLFGHIYMSMRPHRFRRVLMRLRGTGDAA